MWKTLVAQRPPAKLFWVVLAVGCFGPVCPGVPTPPYKSWAFESDCTGVLCGFRVVAGSAQIVGTFHPGEHGLELSGQTIVEADVPLARLMRSGGPEYVAMLARCDGGSTLSATQLVTLDGRPNGETLTSTVRIGGEVEWRWYIETFARHWGGGGGSPTAMRLRLEVTGAGACIVDNVSIGDDLFRPITDRDADSDAGD